MSYAWRHGPTCGAKVDRTPRHSDSCILVAFLVPDGQTATVLRKVKLPFHRTANISGGLALGARHASEHRHAQTRYPLFQSAYHVAPPTRQNESMQPLSTATRKDNLLWWKSPKQRALSTCLWGFSGCGCRSRNKSRNCTTYL